MPPSHDDAGDAFAQARACFQRGLAALAEGRLPQAEAEFAASLVLVPGRVSTLVNLAAVRVERLDGEGALAAAEQVVQAEPGNAEGHFHRAAALGLLGRHAEAKTGYEQVLALGGPAALAWLRHGQALQALDRPSEALNSYERALAADPRLAQAWTNRGNILREMGRGAEAVQAFRQALEAGADPAMHGYYLAALQAHEVPPVAPMQYVEDLFDMYATDFDAHLVGTLGYRGHEALVDPLPQLFPGRWWHSALDLGCGTGLCGPLLRSHVQRLEGVDLSAGMLEQAAARGVYDQLVQADLVAHLAATAQHHDLVLAADVFIYLGELEAVFAGVRRVLEPGGLFGFSVEPAPEPGPPYRLLPSLRYAQSPGYLHALAQRHGFTVRHEAQGLLRRDQRDPVQGLFVFLTG